MRYLLLLFLLQGCSLQAGLSIHNPNLDNPEIQLESVLGIVRGEFRNDNLTYFCEHISAINQTEEGAGLNHCGILINIK